jgi:hypothetical protein
MTVVAVGIMVFGTGTANAAKCKNTESVGGGVSPITAKHVGCKKARKVASASWNKYAANPNKSKYAAKGFTCRPDFNSKEGGKMRCKDGRRKVAYGFGG